MDYSTTDFVVSPYIAEQVRLLIKQPKRVLAFSHSVPASLKQTCVWCGEDGLFPCSDGLGFYYLATVAADANGQRLAELTKPHYCAELQSQEEFMESPEPEFEGPGEED